MSIMLPLLAYDDPARRTVSHPKPSSSPDLTEKDLLVVAARAEDRLCWMEVHLIHRPGMAWQFVLDALRVGIPYIDKTIRGS